MFALRTYNFWKIDPKQVFPPKEDKVPKIIKEHIDHEIDNFESVDDVFNYCFSLSDLFGMGVSMKYNYNEIYRYLLEKDAFVDEIYEKLKNKGNCPAIKIEAMRNGHFWGNLSIQNAHIALFFKDFEYQSDAIKFFNCMPQNLRLTTLLALDIDFDDNTNQFVPQNYPIDISKTIRNRLFSRNMMTAIDRNIDEWPVFNYINALYLRVYHYGDDLLKEELEAMFSKVKIKDFYQHYNAKNKYRHSYFTTLSFLKSGFYLDEIAQRVEKTKETEDAYKKQKWIFNWFAYHKRRDLLERFTTGYLRSNLAQTRARELKKEGF